MSVALPTKALLDRVAVDDLAEYLAQRLGLTQGQRKLELHFSNAQLRRADVHLGPLRPAELAQLVVDNSPA